MFFIRRKSETVGVGNFLGYQFHFSRRRHTVYPGKIQFSLGSVWNVGIRSIKPRGVGEVNVTITLANQVIGAVQPLSFVALGEDGDRPIFLHSANPAIPVFCGNQTPLLIERKAVASDLYSIGIAA